MTFSSAVLEPTSSLEGVKMTAWMVALAMIAYQVALAVMFI
jgi:hypothetical protein